MINENEDGKDNISDGGGYGDAMVLPKMEVVVMTVQI